MFKASDLKKGDIVKIDGDAHIVETIKVQSPAARGAATLYKIRFRNLKSKRKIDQALHGNDVLPEADFERRPVQYLYGDASSITFMDLQDYSQFTLTKDEIEEEWPYLAEGIEGLVTDGAEEGAVVAEDVEAEAGFDEGRVVLDEVAVLVVALGAGGAGVEPGGGVGVAVNEGEGTAHDGGRGVEEFDGGMRNGECRMRRASGGWQERGTLA
jgi:translation elongation factor P/translation initiation factor 5A